MNTRYIPAKIYKFLLPVIVGILFFGCGKEFIVPDFSTDNERKTANDIYSFSSGSSVLSWKGASRIDVLLPTTSLVANYDDQYRVQAKSAIDVWNNVLSSKGIRLNIIESGESDIKIIWSDNLLNNVVGFARFDPSAGGNTKTVTISTNPAGNGNVAQNAALVYRIVIHEFGHILGLWSHSNSDGDIMYPYLTDKRALSNRDTETFSYLYSLAPNVPMQNSGKNSELVGDVNLLDNIGPNAVFCKLNLGSSRFFLGGAK